MMDENESKHHVDTNKGRIDRVTMVANDDLITHVTVQSFYPMKW